MNRLFAIDNRPRPWLRYGCAAMLVAGTVALAAWGPNGVAHQAIADETTEQAAASQSATEETSNGAPVAPSPDKSVVATTGAWESGGITLPEVRVLADGSLVQMTPSLSGIGDGSAQAVIGSTNYAGFNTEYLESDQRGCYSCHADLGDTIKNLGEFRHLLVADGLKVETGYEQCTTCHYENGVRNDLGTILHRIHSDKADCFDCHADVDDEGNLPIWDIARYDELRGITSVSNIEGDFVWDQDTIVAHDDVFNAGWLGNANADRRYEDSLERIPVDEEMFDTWTISVSGAVDQEITWTLPELIEQAPSETRTMKMHCDVNPIGGAMIAQVQVTGIPVSWLLEQAGLTDEAAMVRFYDVDGGGSTSASLNLEQFERQNVLLVYEINGERLNYSDGYPVQVWAGSDFAARDRKQVSEIAVLTEPLLTEVPQAEGTSRGYDKPNVGVIDTVEGQCIQAGEPYTFEGYADAFEQHITSVQFSMDGGETWTTFYTPNADADRWVYWHFTWTPPEENGDTAYHIQIRATTDEGRTTPVPLDLMVNAKADLDGFRAAVEDQIASQGSDDAAEEAGE